MTPFLVNNLQRFQTHVLRCLRPSKKIKTLKYQCLSHVGFDYSKLQKLIRWCSGEKTLGTHTDLTTYIIPIAVSKTGFRKKLKCEPHFFFKNGHQSRELRIDIGPVFALFTDSTDT